MHQTHVQQNTLLWREQIYYVERKTVRFKLVATVSDVRETLNVLGSPTQEYGPYMRCAGTSLKCLGQLDIRSDAIAGIDTVPSSSSSSFSSSSLRLFFYKHPKSLAILEVA